MKCEAAIGLDLGSMVPPEMSVANTWGCGEPATVTLRAACVHEHVKQKHFCAEHGQTTPPNGAWFCLECAQLGHDCPLTPQVVAP